MKEISYIHAEGYPAAEMKHGGGGGGAGGPGGGGHGRRVGKEVRDCYVQESIAGLAH